MSYHRGEKLISLSGTVDSTDGIVGYIKLNDGTLIKYFVNEGNNAEYSKYHTGNNEKIAYNLKSHEKIGVEVDYDDETVMPEIEDYETQLKKKTSELADRLHKIEKERQNRWNSFLVAFKSFYNKDFENLKEQEDLMVKLNIDPQGAQTNFFQIKQFLDKLIGKNEVNSMTEDIKRMRVTEEHAQQVVKTVPISNAQKLSNAMLDEEEEGKSEMNRQEKIEEMNKKAKKIKYEIKEAMSKKEYLQALEILTSQVAIQFVTIDLLEKVFEEALHPYEIHKLNETIIDKLIRLLCAFIKESKGNLRKKAQKIVFNLILKYSTRLETRIFSLVKQCVISLSEYGHLFKIPPMVSDSRSYRDMQKAFAFYSMISLQNGKQISILIRSKAYPSLKDSLEFEEFYRIANLKEWSKPYVGKINEYEDSPLKLLQQRKREEKAITPTKAYVIKPIQHTEINFDLISSRSIEIVDQIRPTQTTLQNKKEVQRAVLKMCKDIIAKDIELKVYGSSGSQFGFDKCDIDLCLKIPSLGEIFDSRDTIPYLQKLHSFISKNETIFKCAEDEIAKGRVPLLKLIEEENQIELDLSISNLLGYANTGLLRTYAKIDDRVKSLGLLVKLWAKRRHINDPPSGSLSSYSYILMVIFFMQQLNILPSLQLLVSHPEVSNEDICKEQYINAFDCRYVSNVEKIQKIWKPDNQDMSIGEIVVRFFRYYSEEFNFKKNAMSVREGESIKKRSTGNISIEDPFEKRDLGIVISDDMSPVILNEFKRAYSILSGEKKKTAQKLSFEDKKEEDKEENQTDIKGKINIGKISYDVKNTSVDHILEERTENVDETNIYTKKETYEECNEDMNEIRRLIEKGELHEGVLRMNERVRFKEAYVSVKGFLSDILISGMTAINRAIHGDVVAIKILDEDVGTEKDSKTDVPQKAENLQGVVVCILKKKSPNLYPCKLAEENKAHFNRFKWVYPLDKKYPRMVVDYKQFGEKFGVRADSMDDFLVAISTDKEWKPSQRHAKGTLQGAVGMKKDLWTQKRSIFMQYMPFLFSPFYDLREESTIKTPTFNITTNDISSKFMPIGNDEAQTIHDLNIDFESQAIKDEYEDYRKKRIFTIDPASSRDLDDSIFVEKIQDECNDYIDVYKVGVYIADVCAFIEEDSELDLDARQRATSVYMIDCVEHMLSPILSQNLCSLLPGVTRFSLGVEWIYEVDKQTKEIKIREGSEEFKRVLLKSCVKLSYEMAQDVIEGKEKPDVVPEVYNHKWEDIRNDIVTLNKISQQLFEQRKKRGALFLNDRELQFVNDENGFPVGTYASEHNESHQLIEELMLEANTITGSQLYKYFGEEAILRTHQEPEEEKWRFAIYKLSKSFTKFRVAKGDITEEDTKVIDIHKMLKEQLPSQVITNRLIEQTKKYDLIEKTVQHNMLRQQQLAKYNRAGDCSLAGEEMSHYALKIDHYTHFTSPIRRYADVIAHRMVLHLMKLKKENAKEFDLPETLKSDSLSLMVENINNQAESAKTIQEKNTRLYLSYYLDSLLEDNLLRKEAIVLSLGRRSFTVYIPDYCTEVKVDVMNNFLKPPNAINDIEEDVEDDGDDTNEEDTGKEENEVQKEKEKKKGDIESLTLTWNKPNGEHERSIELFVLKSIQVDVKVLYDACPWDIGVFNIWENDQKLKEGVKFEKLNKDQIKNLYYEMKEKKKREKELLTENQYDSKRNKHSNDKKGSNNSKPRKRNTRFDEMNRNNKSYNENDHQRRRSTRSNRDQNSHQTQQHYQHQHYHEQQRRQYQYENQHYSNTYPNNNTDQQGSSVIPPPYNPQRSQSRGRGRGRRSRGRGN